MAELTVGYDAWIDRLSEQDLPVMAGVLNELKNVTEDSESSAVQISEIILKDASLTSHLLKVANCVYYNPVTTPISTVSRAVVQLGTAAIKSICISALVIEQFLQGGCRERLLSLLANAFHTATQSKILFQQSGDGNSEEAEAVVIAGLLFNLGEMAFWSFGGEQADQLDALIEQSDLTIKECEKKVIGTTLKDLTLGLSEKWGLGKTLQEALRQEDSKKESVKALQIGSELVQVIQCGWESEAFEETLNTISEHYDIDPDEARVLAIQGAEEAANVALSYGANQLCHLIPSATNSRRLDKSEPMASDSELQLNILRELGTMAQEKVDLNTLFHTVLEWLHRGVGFERVAITLLNKEHSQLTAKYVIRKRPEDWQEKFVVPLDDKKSVFNRCLELKELIVIEKDSGHKLLANECSLLENDTNAMLAPILVNDRLLGVYYADQGSNELLLDKARKEGFQHFVQQANMCLTVMVAKK